MTAAVGVFGAIAVTASVAMLANSRNPVGSVLSFLCAMVAVAGLAAIEQAHFVAAALLWIQAGVALVGVPFAIDLQNLESPSFTPGRDRILKTAGGLLLLWGTVEGARAVAVLPALVPTFAAYGGAEALGRTLFAESVLVTETVSLVLATALLGALALDRREGGPG